MTQLKAAKVMYFLLFIVFSFSCKTQNLSAENLLISMEKTPCFGTCPAYKLEIFSSGLVLFNGISNHEMIGNYKAQVDSQTLGQLVEKFRRSEFFNFKKAYTADVQDLPTTYLFFKDNGTEKMVQDYYNAPQKLKELEQHVEALIPLLKWKKVDQ